MPQAKTSKTAKSAAVKPATKAIAKVKAAPVAQARTAAQARAEELIAEIQRRKERIAEDFFDIGLRLRELSEKKLYGALGYASFKEMLEAREVMSLSQAHRLIRVVRGLPREKALAIGSEKASLLASYADASPEVDNPVWLLEQGTLPSGKRVADASTREISDALKNARGKAKRRLSPEETAARTSARRAQAALRKRGAKQATITILRRQAAFWARIEVPVDALSELFPARDA